MMTTTQRPQLDRSLSRSSLRPEQNRKSQMKLREKLAGAILVAALYSFVWFVAVNTPVTVYNVCEREGGNDVSRAALVSTLPSENLKRDEYTVILSAIASVKNRTKRKVTVKTPVRLNFTPQRGFYHDPKSAWYTFKTLINNREIYAESPESRVDELLRNLVSLPIVEAAPRSGGTQLKLIFTLDDGTKALFKPMRFKREVEAYPDHYYFSDFERHYAEIAAFHLDRVLAFHRVPPTAGRLVNITRDIERLIDDDDFIKTIFISPAGNKCFYGKCSYYCDTNHAFCGQGDVIEGSMAAYIPERDIEVARRAIKSPWRRSYSKHKKADWETNQDYCKNETLVGVSRKGRRLNDLMDMAIFDFLTGNLDRHHYDIFKEFGDNGFPVLIDNGRGFGHSRKDDLSILTPLNQCCRIRLSTLEKLLRLTQPPNRLSDLMRESLSKDRLPKILLEPHLVALDRRLLIALRTVHDCLERREFKDIIVDDGY